MVDGHEADLVFVRVLLLVWAHDVLSAFSAALGASGAEGCRDGAEGGRDVAVVLCGGAMAVLDVGWEGGKEVLPRLLLAFVDAIPAQLSHARNHFFVVGNVLLVAGDNETFAFVGGFPHWHWFAALFAQPADALEA